LCLSLIHQNNNKIKTRKKERAREKSQERNISIMNNNNYNNNNRKSNSRRGHVFDHKRQKTGHNQNDPSNGYDNNQQNATTQNAAVASLPNATKQNLTAEMQGDLTVNLAASIAPEPLVVIDESDLYLPFREATTGYWNDIEILRSNLLAAVSHSCLDGNSLSLSFFLSFFLEEHPHTICRHIHTVSIGKANLAKIASLQIRRRFQRTFTAKLFDRY
jgi:hypothetical protein